MKDPGFLGVPNVPEYVRSACDITRMSAHERVGHGSTRTGVVVRVADRRASLLSGTQCRIKAWALWAAAQGPPPAEGLQRLSEINLL